MNKQNTFSYLKGAGLLYGSPDHPVGGTIPFPGNVFFVNSAHADAADSIATDQGKSWDKPFATIDYAVGRCTSNNGDVVFVAPAHTETIGGASALELDVAGVSVIGVVVGTKRPRLDFTALAGTVEVNANNVFLSGFQFYADVTDGVTVALDIKTTVLDFLCVDCRFENDSSTKEFLKHVTMEGSNFRCAFIDCYFTGDGDCSASISPEALTIQLECVNCRFDGLYSNTVLDLDVVTAQTGGYYAYFRDCCLINRDTDAGAGGIVKAPGTSAYMALSGCSIFYTDVDAYPASGKVSLANCQAAEWGVAAASYGTGAALATQADFSA